MRTLNHWGWGFSDKFPDASVRRQFGQMVAGGLGLSGLEPREPVPLENVEIRAPRIETPSELTTFVHQDVETRVRHTYGRAFPDLLRGFRGDFQSAPDAVAFPTDEAQLQSLMAHAAKEGIALIPRGGGTSVVGGVNGDQLDRPFICVSLRKMNQVIEIDRECLLARVQGGATGPEFEQRLREHDLTFRHFPQSYEFSTIGGWVATRAGGHFATGQTRIDDFVASTRMVTPEGVFESRTLPGSGAGPSPDALVVGSEGILGFITEATLRVHIPPRFRSTGTFRFESLDEAVSAAKELAQSRLFPSNCRLLDSQEALMNQVVFDGSHLLIVGFESASASTAAVMLQAADICERHGGRCTDGLVHKDAAEKSGGSGAAGNWRQAFFDGPYRQNILLSLGAVVDTFETACTWQAFPAMHEDVKSSIEQLFRSKGLLGVVSCRFTHVYPDGPAPYYTFICTAPEGEELAVWKAVKQTASDALMRHKATITHHHAVGRTHRPWYDQQRPELFAEALRATKSRFDPKNVLNPGVLIDQDENSPA